MLHKAARRVFSFIYLVTLAVFTAASVTTVISPSSLRGFSFSGLVYPYLLLVVVILTGLCLFYRLRLSILGILLLLLSYKNISVIAAFNKPGTFNISADDHALRVMTWNVRRFTPYNADYFDPRKSNMKEIIEEVKRHHPDVICFQEFYSSREKKGANLDDFIDSLGYRHYIFSREANALPNMESGIVIFSRLPIIRSYIYHLSPQVSTGAESPVAADILVGKDTVRIGIFHMQSYGFLNRDYRDLARIRNQEDTGLSAWRNIYRKMRYAFSLRGRQADIVKEKMNASPYPLILCGDLNDVPNSYSYFTLRGDMNDAFLEKGSGLGKSFISGRSRFLTWLPTLRIDYIFTDPGIRVVQFGQVMRKLSDHRGLIADIELGEK